MQYGAHLPLIDFDGRGWHRETLSRYAGAARELRYGSIAANDHLVFQRPWLDGLVALASVVEASGDLQLATTVSLPVVRGPAALAKAAAALDIVSGGRLVLGVGAGSSANDYACAGVPFDERWSRFGESVGLLRAALTGRTPPGQGRFYPAYGLEPRPNRPEGLPILIASWGSDAGLRRVARSGDGWLASAYNSSPAQVVTGREKLAVALARAGRSLDGFPCWLGTMWMYVTDDSRARDARLAGLAAMLNRPEQRFAGHVLVGPPEHCAEVLRAYAEAGIDRVLVWPVADEVQQLERFMRDVAPLV